MAEAKNTIQSTGVSTATAPSSANTKQSHHHGKKSQPQPNTPAVTKIRTEPSSTPTLDDSQVSRTRLCIKNIPSQMSASDVRRFISTHPSLTLYTLKMTDCYVWKPKTAVPHTKKSPPGMAFVGFATADQASHVMHIMHQAYCHTHKLVVEPAQLKTVKAQENANEPTIQDTTKDTATTTHPSTVLPSSTDKDGRISHGKRKFWSNDDDDDFGTNLNHSTDAVPTPLQLPTVPPEELSEDDESDEKDDNNQVALNETATVEKPQARVSDMDFLRSKQVAVEDLETISPTNPQSSAPDTTIQSKKEDKDDDSQLDNSSHSSESDSSSSDEDVVVPLSVSNATKASVTPQVVLAEEDSPALEPDTNTVNESEVCVENRLFIRNLPFDATEEDLQELFVEFGDIEECHIPVDDRKHSKGYAFVSFGQASSATRARQALDGRDFQGRLLHILPARAPPQSTLQPPAHLSYKEQQEWIKQQQATKDSKGWSASYVRGDAVVDNLAVRLGLRKGDVLNVKDQLSAGDAAVRMALGETAIIEENRVYFHEHGIDMEALVSGDLEQYQQVPRSKTALLVKNLPYDTTHDELMKMFGSAGDTPTRILLPPSHTIAVIEYPHGNDAKRVFKRLAYRRFKNVPLYLEWAPIVSIGTDQSTVKTTADEAPEVETTEEVEGEILVGPTATLHVKNLNFITTDDELLQFFRKITPDVRAVRIPKKIAASSKKGTESETREMSMGYGFVEFGSHAAAQLALKKANGAILDGYKLEVQPSSSSSIVLPKNATAKALQAAKKNTKLMVRNVPFQATRTELLKLFGSFGSLKKVRLPKKFDGGHRGFAFIEYVTHAEAWAAMQSLSRTHLYGRHLVLEWAATDEEVDNLDHLREKAQKDVSQQQRPNKKIKFT
jgi:multiple RNA-binding domain-containing protein 1